MLHQRCSWWILQIYQCILSRLNSQESRYLDSSVLHLLCRWWKIRIYQCIFDKLHSRGSKYLDRSKFVQLSKAKLLCTCLHTPYKSHLHSTLNPRIYKCHPDGVLSLQCSSMHDQPCSLRNLRTYQCIFGRFHSLRSRYLNSSMLLQLCSLLTLQILRCIVGR